MSWLLMMKDAGVYPLLACVLMVGAVLGAVVVGILRALKISAPVPVALLPAALLPVVALAAHTLGRHQALFSAAHAPAEMKQTMIAGGISVRMGSLMGVGLMLGVVALVGCLVAIAAATRQESRSWAMGAVGLGFGVLSLIFAMAGLALQSSMSAVLVQTALLALPVIGTAFAMTGEDRHGRSGAVLAASLLALSVAGGHTLTVTASLAEGFRAIAVAPPEMKQAFMLDILTLSGRTAMLGIVATTVSLVLPFLAAARVRDPGDRPGALLAAGLATTGLLLAVITASPMLSLLVQP